MTNLRLKILYSILWQYGERISVQGINFLVTIILARILLPNEYGIVSFASIFITLLEVFVISGLGNALVQKKDIEEIDFSTVFIFNFVLSLFLFVALFFFSPIISRLYNNSELIWVIRLMSIRIVISAFNTIQQAYVQKMLQFKVFFYAAFISSVISAIFGIIFAYNGFGVYSLVVQYLSASVINTITLSLFISWRPKLLFSLSRLFPLLNYGWKILLSGLLSTGFNELKGFLVGKKYTMSELAYYDRGKQFPSLVYENINVSLGKVLFPVMSVYQDDKLASKKLMRKSLKFMSFVLFPLLFSLISISDLVVKILLTDKWIGAVPFLQVACLTYMFVLFNTVFTNAINAFGRSDFHLKVEIINIVLGLILLLVLMNMGAIYIAISITISSLISAVIRFFLVRRLFSYSYFELCEDVLASCFNSLLVFVLLLLLDNITDNVYVLLLVKIIVAICVYMIASLLFNNGLLKECIYIIRSFRKGYVVH